MQVLARSPELPGGPRPPQRHITTAAAYTTQALSRDAGLAVRVRPGKRIESGKMRPSIFGLLGNRVPARLCPFRASWAVRTELVAFPARPSLQPRAHITS